MTDTLFVSDLHLDAGRPQATAAFVDLLRGDARNAGRLFILGDLFEFWIGDDDDAPLATEVSAALAEYTASGHQCLVMPGNRDFLLGEQFAARTGVRLLSDPTIAEIHHGEQVLLMHGDQLCTDDLAYQQHRRRMHNRLVQRLFLTLPRRWRRAAGAEGRRRSRAHISASAARIMDVNEAAVREQMLRHGVQLLIHGHTHRSAIHRFDLNGKAATRIVLGDWYREASVLRWSPSGYELKALPFG